MLALEGWDSLRHALGRPPQHWEQLNYFDLLEVDPGASDEEIRRAHRRQREMYAPESMAIAGLYAPDGLEAVQRRIEDAYDTLLDAERRHAYDLDLFPSGVPARRGTPPGVPLAVGAASTPATGIAAAAVEPPPERLPEPIITPDTEIDGPLLRRLREARGVALADSAARTKVGASHLRAIEDERWEALPAEVYLRGFLVEFARYLRLEPPQVTQSYLQRFRRNRPPQTGG